MTADLFFGTGPPHRRLMAHIGHKKGSTATWFIPDGKAAGWRARGNRIIRKARPEDGKSDSVVLLSSIKPKPPAELVLAPIRFDAAPEVLHIVAAETQEPERQAKRRRRAE